MKTLLTAVKTSLTKNLLIGSLIFSAANAAFAAEANTSAGAGGALGRPGTATAAAGYVGDRGFTRTEANSGRVSTAGAVALGVDESGLSLSISNAIAPQHGPALATNYNLSVGRDGRVSSSAGVSIADGPIQREVRVSGETATTRNGGGATSIAEGSSDRFGTVRTHSTANDSGPRLGPATPRRFDTPRRFEPARRFAGGPARELRGVREVKRGLVSARSM